MTTPLQTAAQAVIARWESPKWKDEAPTAVVIGALLKALTDEQAQAVEPFGWVINGMSEVMSRGHAQAVQTEHQAMGGTAVAYPVYLHPAPPATGERAELIAHVKDTSANLEPYQRHRAKGLRAAADMLEADAQEIAGWKADQKENMRNQVALQEQINDLKAQQVAVPLTEAQIFECDPVPHVMFDQQRIDFARAIEAFHGIGAKLVTKPDSLPDSPPSCNPHPDAPHGFSRNASHSAGRYVCDCEGWIQDWSAA